MHNTIENELKKLIIWSTFKVSWMIVNYGNHNIAYSTFCTFQPLAVIPRLAAQWRKTRAPNANGVGTALSYGTVAVSPDRIEAWGASTEAAVTWSSYHNWTSTWNNPAVRLHLSPCERRGICSTGTMGMVRGCAEDARCHTAHMSSLTYESRLNAGYWLCLRGSIGSQTFQQQQRECSEVDAARRRAPWIPKQSEYLQQHLYTALVSLACTSAYVLAIQLNPVLNAYQNV